MPEFPLTLVTAPEANSKSDSHALLCMRDWDMLGGEATCSSWCARENPTKLLPPNNMKKPLLHW
jgi:hypothetical protein